MGFSYLFLWVAVIVVSVITFHYLISLKQKSRFIAIALLFTFFLIVIAHTEYLSASESLELKMPALIRKIVFSGILTVVYVGSILFSLQLFSDSKILKQLYSPVLKHFRGSSSEGSES